MSTTWRGVQQLGSASDVTLRDWWDRAGHLCEGPARSAAIGHRMPLACRGVQGRVRRRCRTLCFGRIEGGPVQECVFFLLHIPDAPSAVTNKVCSGVWLKLPATLVRRSSATREAHLPKLGQSRGISRSRAAHPPVVKLRWPASQHIAPSVFRGRPNPVAGGKESVNRTRAQRRNLERGRERWGPQDISLFAALVRKEGRRKKHSRKAFRVRRRGMTWRAESGMPASAAPPFAP